MKTLLLILLSGFFVVFATAAVLGQSSESELNLGVEAYKNAKFKEAIEHLQRSVADDSSNLRARLYLATALAEQYIPGFRALIRRIITKWENRLYASLKRYLNWNPPS
jgi:Tfp pilus assembly protein PilF